LNFDLVLNRAKRPGSARNHISVPGAKNTKPKRAASRRTAKRTAAPLSDRIRALAEEQFGFQSLRPGQEEAITALLAKRDVLTVQPTGSGKSAIYQIAGLMMKGATLVISPLIALQKDQVDSLNEIRAEEAVALNSTQPAADARHAKQKVEEGTSKFILLAPEQLRRQETIDMLASASVSLFVVDEAHCISEWGHDFRPDYLHLGAVLERLGHPAVLAMTATASPEVREEIVQRLAMRKPKILVLGLDRPNIHLRVDHFPTEQEKTEALIHRIRWANKPGIVYVATRKKAEEVMALLADENIRALFYHGGLKAKERTAVQEQFMSNEAEVIIATSAFGMGIDKADIRFVYHHDVPSSLDSYYQEIGRAGRDGESAEAVLFFRPEDLGVQKFLSGESRLDPEQVEQVADYVADQEGPVEPDEIADKSNLSERKVVKALHRLEDVGAVEMGPTGDVQIVDETDLTEASRAAAAEQESRKKFQEERLNHMREYADLSTCRREFLLRYFGDDFTGPCHNCDNCEVEAAEGSGDIPVDPNVGTRREVRAD
jgi:ATP-dependent DNA helicase RecQ